MTTRALQQLPEAARVRALDALRGLTIIGMVMVTAPGLRKTFPQLRHAAWNDPTLADLVFPSFLVVTGISLVLSFAGRLGRGARQAALAWHVLRRAVLLVVLGLVVNWLYDLSWQHLRLPGILQRIGLCYLLVGWGYLGMQVLGFQRRARCLVAVFSALGVLAVYWALLRLYPTPGFGPGRLDSLGALPAVVDRAVFTVPHLFRYGVLTPGIGVTYDPEGLLSTLGAFAAVLFGVGAGEVLRSGRTVRQRTGAIAMFGTVLWVAGLLLRPAMVINKPLYTPPFALWSTGLCLLGLAGLMLLMDVAKVRHGWGLLLIYGTNAVFAFVLSQVLLSLYYSIPASVRTNAPVWASARLFEGFLSPHFASLLFAFCFVLFNAALIYPLYRRRIFLRL